MRAARRFALHNLLPRSRLYLTPMGASEVEAEALRVSHGTALFHMRRETYLRSGALAELFTCALSPHAFRLLVEQSVDQDEHHTQERP